jgi:hypothetical protein
MIIVMIAGAYFYRENLCITRIASMIVMIAWSDQQIWLDPREELRNRDIIKSRDLTDGSQRECSSVCAAVGSYVGNR